MHTTKSWRVTQHGLPCGPPWRRRSAYAASPRHFRPHSTSSRRPHPAACPADDRQPRVRQGTRPPHRRRLSVYSAFAVQSPGRAGLPLPRNERGAGCSAMTLGKREVYGSVLPRCPQQGAWAGGRQVSVLPRCPRRAAG